MGFLEDLFFSSEVTELPELGQPDPESASLEPELMEVPELGEVLISGDPFEIGPQLDDHQGDNIYNFQGDCGLVSVANLLTMAGIEVTEDEVVGRAISMNKCQYSLFSSPEDNGGTSVLDRQEILRSYGINATILDSKTEAGSLEAIAAYVTAGYGVNISVNAGYAWDDPNYIGDGSSNHSIVVTGAVWDPDTGALKGLYVCDSGTDGEAVFLSKDVLEDAYSTARGTTALVTDQPIR